MSPFLFAFAALTGLLFVNAVAQKLESLSGKGLGWEILLEFALLSLPHTIALTLPMAVLVAVLYTFSDLAANNEITAMAAGGVKPSRILLPVILAGAVGTGGMLYFNDRILPEANHELKNLLIDIGNKSPTLELREQVVNRIRNAEGRTLYYLQAARIDRQTNGLHDVVIYDVSEPTQHRTTYADWGTMAFDAAGTDLYLTLHDGVTYEAEENEASGFSRLRFDRQVVPLRGVGDVLERRARGSQRSDREMSIAMLAASAREKEEEREELVEEIRLESLEAVQQALGRSGAGEEGEGGEDGGGEKEKEGSEEGGVIAQATAEPSGVRRAPATPVASGPDRALPRDGLTQKLALTVRTKAAQVESLSLSSNRYRVEMHKKYAIAFACLVFVLIGAPIAVRFPRGGVGMTIAVSVGVFGIYWMGLIGGERLADRGHTDPAVAMWATNALFLVLGLIMSLRLGRWVATARGGGWSDLLYTVRRIFRRLLQKAPPVSPSARAETKA